MVAITLNQKAAHIKTKGPFLVLCFFFAAAMAFHTILWFQASILMDGIRPTENISNISPSSDVISTPDHSIVDFERQDGVVIVVKIHGGKGSKAELTQSLCLLKQAYNGRMNYDHLIFTTEPLDDEYVELLEDIVAPARLQVVSDSRPLQEEIAAMTEVQREKFLERCDTDDPSEITWKWKCKEYLPEVGDRSLGYNWMSEFRTKYIWTHPALDPYKYAMWFDSDAFPTRVWDQDPIATMIRNDLVIYFDNFPSGRIYDDGVTIPTRVRSAFNTSICSVTVENGHLVAETGTEEECPTPEDDGLETIHGFFHITNLDFFRSEPYQIWANILIGDNKFSRQLNDEVAVTVATALLAPERSWSMQDTGMDLRVMHNGRFDGKERYARNKKKVKIDGKKRKWYSYVVWWVKNGEEEFPEAWHVCQDYVTADG